MLLVKMRTSIKSGQFVKDILIFLFHLTYFILAHDFHLLLWNLDLHSNIMGYHYRYIQRPFILKSLQFLIKEKNTVNCQTFEVTNLTMHVPLSDQNLTKCSEFLAVV